MLEMDVDRSRANKAPARKRQNRKSQTSANEPEKKGTPRQSPEQRLRRIMQMLRQMQPGGELAAFASRQEWERLVDSNPPESQDLLRELARFADLWRYFQEREEKLGPEIVRDVGQVHRLNLAERASQLKDINRRLMQRVNDASKGTQSRH